MTAPIAPAPDGRTRRSAPLPGRPLQVLLVEDSPTDRLLTRAALQEADRPIAVHVVDNGAEAMAFVRKKGRFADAATPDLVLLDLNLPRMDGREVLMRIKSDPRLRHIPVVVLTTSASPDDVAAAYEAHANSFITKPVDYERLREVLKLVERYWCEVVRLPDEVGSGRTSLPAPASHALPPLANRALRMLVVEDSASDLLLLRHAVSTGLRQVELTSASDLASALSQLAAGAFDVVITDLSLPDARGMDAIRALRYAAPSTPLLVLTGTSDVDTGEQAMAAGAEDYLVKDQLSGAGIARAVRYALRREEARADRQQRQRMESVGRLAAGVAHDFNNLLTAISASADLAGTAESPQEVRELVEEIVAATMRGRTLTRQLLAFSRRDRFDPRPLSVNTLLRSIERLLHRLVGEGIEIRLQLEEGVPDTRADPHLVEQVVVNLALNARDAMGGRGGLTLASGERTLDATEAAGPDPEVRPGRYVRIAVGDTGPGIPDEVRAHIFEPFFTTKDEGTGLGLATVREIVAQHGGVVRIASEPAGGTTFEVLLPAIAESPSAGDQAPEPRAAPAEAPRAAPVETLAEAPAAATVEASVETPREALRTDATAATPPASPAAATPPPTILLVEDEGAVRRLVQLVLQRAGYRVLEADCADRAWAVWQANGAQVDLVLTDMVMPGTLSSLELARRITAESASVPVIFMSGYSSAFQEPGVALVADENFLAKPFTPDGLLRLLARRLAARPAAPTMATVDG